MSSLGSAPTTPRSFAARQPQEREPEPPGRKKKKPAPKKQKWVYRWFFLIMKLPTEAGEPSDPETYAPPSSGPPNAKNYKPERRKKGKLSSGCLYFEYEITYDIVEGDTVIHVTIYCTVYFPRNRRQMDNAAQNIRKKIKDRKKKKGPGITESVEVYAVFVGHTYEATMGDWFFRGVKALKDLLRSTPGATVTAICYACFGGRFKLVREYADVYSSGFLPAYANAANPGKPPRFRMTSAWMRFFEWLVWVGHKRALEGHNEAIEGMNKYRKPRQEELAPLEYNPDPYRGPTSR